MPRAFCGSTSKRTSCPIGLWGVEDEPRPLAVQIWDNDPATLAAVGAKLAHEFKVSVVDINFGCPVQASDRKGAQRLVSAAISRSRGRDRRARGGGLRARRR